VLVLPSEYETFGIVLLEAMAAGVPIVASRAGGIPEVVDDGGEGILVEPNDSRALASALHRLLEDKSLRMEMGLAGRLKARRYDWARVVERVEQVYEQLAN
ncbi:MAG TPA: glycosyltransferase family 4 protein, partial [Burkholderiales bacterium]|nr:glycosyltransferase family 4 protein [Burkholderiales bacterium]